MRHIHKFKVFDHDLHKWVQDACRIGNGGNLEIEAGIEMWVDVMDTPERFSVFKFTGESDSNAGDIFAGDIIEIIYDDGETDLTFVEFDKGGYMVDADFGECDILPIGWAIENWDAGNTRYLVVGNICEHASMLTNGENDEKDRRDRTPG